MKEWGTTHVEHVLHVVSRDEGIVDGDHLHIRLVAGSTQDKTTDAAKTINTDLDRSPEKADKMNKRVHLIK